MKITLVNATGFLATASALAASAYAGNLVQNGSFEAVQIGAPFVSHNLADIPDWTYTGSTGDGPLWHVGYADSDGSITVAGDGNQFVTLGGGFGPFGTSDLDQVLSGLTIGDTYDLVFKMAAEANFSGPQSLTVDFPSGSSTASQTFTAATPPVNYWSDWETKSMTFTATATAVDLQFTASTVFDVGLDDVSVTAAIATPDVSSTVEMLGVAVALMGGVCGFGKRSLKR